MDGEIASEHYAGIRYRNPDIAALYEPYVCVIASVYRHTPRDYDEQGSLYLLIRIPNDPGLTGLTFYHQAITYGSSGVEAISNLDISHIQE